MLGTVYKSTGSWYTVKSDEGEWHSCRIKGKFRIQGIKSTNPVAVGDRVRYSVEDQQDERVGVIEEILDRRNYIVRKSVKLSKQLHIIAANLDRVFLLITLDNPVTFEAFIDRFLVTSEAYDIPATLLFNKVDTYDEEGFASAEALISVYETIGYDCLRISAKTGLNVEAVRERMRDVTSMFSGHSGVGKSTLVNRLEPGLELKTAEISEVHLQGQHTTTFAEMYDLSFGGRIIDTPGIRGFGVVDIEPEEVGDYFPEFFERKSECKFHNCLHVDEPGCAVKAALESGDIAWSRYRSYLQLLDGEEERFRVDNYGG